MSSFIQSSSMSIIDDSDVIQIIKNRNTKNYQNYQEIRTWSTELISTTNGFMGSYYRLTVTFENSIKLTFFVKTPPPYGPQNEYMKQTGVFNKEIVMYDQIIPQIGYGKTKWAPDCFLCKDNVIVMEDLEALQFATVSKHQDLDFDTLKCLFGCFARLHSRSLIFEEKLREQKKSLVDFWPDILKENLFKDTGRSMMYQKSSLMGIRCLIDAVLPEEAQQQTMDKIFRWWKKIFDSLKPSKKYRNVICHRDVWTANFMFRRENDKPVDCRLIDFQYYSYINPAMDLAISLYMNTSRKIRDENFDELIRIYYDAVRECLEEETLNVEDIFKWNDFKRSCTEARSWGLIYIIFGHQMTLLDDQAWKKYFAKEPKLLDEVIYGDKRTELVTMQFKENKLFREKFTDNIWEIFECLPEQVPE